MDDKTLMWVLIIGALIVGAYFLFFKEASAAPAYDVPSSSGDSRGDRSNTREWMDDVRVGYDFVSDVLKDLRELGWL